MTQLTRTALPALLALALAGTVACVHRVETPTVDQPRPAPVADNSPPSPLTPPDRTLHFEPIEIKSSPAQVAISDLNDEELFAIGTSAMAGGDNAKAALHFERLADFFPASTHRAVALYDAGILLERMKDFAGAVGRFTEAVKAYGPTTPEGIEARFKLADAYYVLADYDTATTLLEQLVQIPELPAVRRVEADTKRAICLFTANRLDEAEKLLRATIADMKDNLRDEVRDAYMPSQAQFYLAEVYRQHFLDAKLDPSTSTQEQLIGDLEYKAQMLLSAQGHYLRCIRLGHPEWATASGFRVGELYQNLYAQMVDSRVPVDLDAEQVGIYREELRNKVKVLVTKAIDAYEKTLSTAERVGATNPFVAQTKEQLDKMKALLLEGDATAKGPEKPGDRS